MDIILLLKMGQSMQKPIRSLNRNSSTRLSARSLKSSNQSTNRQKRTCLSASKCKINNQQPAAQCSLSEENTQIKNGELFLMSRHEQSSPSLKQSNKLRSQKSGLGIQNSQLSPNFKEIAEAGVQYGLPTWNLSKGNKQYLQFAHSEPHNDITISFSQPKNIISNPFRQDSELRKSKLHQILQYQQENHKEVAINNHNQNIASLAGEFRDKRQQGSQKIDSGKYRNRQSEEISKKAEETKKTNILKMTDQFVLSADKKQQKTISSNANEQSLPTSSQTNGMKNPETNYNDYDCADFRRKIKEFDGGKKQIKISKKMQQLKQKIVTKAATNKDKEQILKKSINRLSQSFRKYRQGHSLSNRSRDISQQKSKPVLSKISSFNISIQGFKNDNVEKKHEQDNALQKNGTKTQQKFLIQSKQSQIKSTKDQKSSLKRIRSSDQLGKTTNSSGGSTTKKAAKRKQSKICLLNSQNDYISQNLIVNDSQTLPLRSTQMQSTKRKGPSFVEMIKKDHFGNGIKKKSQRNIIQQGIKYSHIEGVKTETSNQHIFASTCQGNKFLSIQEYQFFGAKQQKKKDEELVANKQKMNFLKMITQQLTNKNRQIKTKSPYINQLAQNSSQEPSIRNKTYQHQANSFDKTREKFISLNYSELNGRIEEYMLRDALDRQKQGQEWAKEQKKRYKSSQHSSKTNGVKSRLLAF